MIKRQITVDGTKIAIQFETDNDAFCDANRDAECERIIRTVRDRALNGQFEGNCMDVNGNTVGQYAPIS